MKLIERHLNAFEDQLRDAVAFLANQVWGKERFGCLEPFSADADRPPIR